MPSIPNTPGLKPSPARKSQIQLATEISSSPSVVEIEHISPTTYAIMNTGINTSVDPTLSLQTRCARRHAAGQSGGIFQILHNPQSWCSIEQASRPFVFDLNLEQPHNRSSVEDDKENTDIHFDIARDKERAEKDSNNSLEDKELGSKDNSCQKSDAALDSEVVLSLQSETLLSALPPPLNTSQRTPATHYRLRNRRPRSTLFDPISSKYSAVSLQKVLTPSTLDQAVQLPSSAKPVEVQFHTIRQQSTTQVVSRTRADTTTLCEEMTRLTSGIKSTLYRFRNRKSKEPEFRILNRSERTSSLEAVRNVARDATLPEDQEDEGEEVYENKVGGDVDGKRSRHYSMVRFPLTWQAALKEYPDNDASDNDNDDCEMRLDAETAFFGQHVPTGTQLNDEKDERDDDSGS